MPVGTTRSEDTHPPPYEAVNENSHLLWDTFMFPSEDVALHSVSPATIITLLAEDDTSRFSTPITPHLLAQSTCRLQAHGGANWLVTNNMDMLHVSWDIKDYLISGIGDGIRCTAKGIFYLLCNDGSILPVTMYYPPWKPIQ